jgi:hypothetical protein
VARPCTHEAAAVSSCARIAAASAGLNTSGIVTIIVQRFLRGRALSFVT